MYSDESLSNKRRTNITLLLLGGPNEGDVRLLLLSTF